MSCLLRFVGNSQNQDASFPTGLTSLVKWTIFVGYLTLPSIGWEFEPPVGSTVFGLGIGARNSFIHNDERIRTTKGEGMDSDPG